MPQKLNREMMVLGDTDNHHAAITLPPGKVIEILGPAEDDRFLRIQVDGQVFEAFEADVAERCRGTKARSAVK